MENKVECPNCLGTGEGATRRVVRKCVICKGGGFVSEDMYHHYIEEHLFDNL
tara:strand:- start:66820 stop:66975 length:156 start_codon:yes stop_codon:yes gene_type:complete